jgi:hypothetical protein
MASTSDSIKSFNSTELGEAFCLVDYLDEEVEYVVLEVLVWFIIFWA